MSKHRPSFSMRRNSTRSTRESGGNAPAGHSRRALRDAALYACEQLESRRLLTTMVGGGVVDGVLQENTYTYLDANNNTIRVALWGTITAEFLFVKVNFATNATTVEGSVAPTVANIAAFAGADLFSVYVASASPTASIVIAQENTAANSGNPIEGFSASNENSITVNDAQGGAPIVVAPLADSGAVWLGARAYVFKPGVTPAAGLPVDGRPILSVPLTTQVGVRPVTADDTLLAGVVTAPGVSLNRFFLGGQLTGRVDLGGSINTFYAGDIWTGDADGLSPGNQPADVSLQRNFNVAGDIDNLIALGRIGTEGVSAVGTPDYETGFRLSVSGHVGQINTNEGFMGSVYVANLPSLRGLGVPQTEEYITGPVPPALSGETFFEGNTDTSDGTDGVPSLADNTAFEDSTPGTAQYLGTPFSSAMGRNAIQLEGSLDDIGTATNSIDYYAVALGAEQTITATLKLPYLDYGILDLGILAPEAGYAAGGTTDILATTYDVRGIDRLANQPLTFTSTDAGIYYFAVGYEGDTTFAGTAGAVAGTVDYELDITGVKNLGIGAIVAANNIDLISPISENETTGIESAAPSLRVDYGDIGALVSTNILVGDSDGGAFSNAALPITATTGSIRVIQANQIGNTGADGTSLAPDINAAGNVGVIRTTGTGAMMALNPAFDDDATAVGISNGLSSSAPIGGDYQLIDCAGNFAGNLVADGSIGTLRTGTIGLDGLAPVLHVNAANSKTPGHIDLIDVTGAFFGTLATGGPAIITGPGGNVGYIHVAPDTTVFNDNYFGGSEDFPITYTAGVSADLIDDSGTPFSINPYRGQSVTGDLSAAETATATTTTTGVTSVATGDSLSVLTYGIEGTGGVVVLSVTVTPGTLTIDNAGVDTVSTVPGPTALSVDTQANGTNGSVDFGEINMVGAGTDLAFDDLTRTFTSTGSVAAQSDNTTFAGKSPIGVYDFDATTAALGGAGTTAVAIPAGVNQVINTTSGEIVNFRAASVTTLEAGSLGVAKSDVDAPVAGATIFSNTYPFHDQRTMIQVDNAQTIESSGPLGNILATGTLGNVLADVGTKRLSGAEEGIDGPIYATGAAGNILNINIGDGLGSSGSGYYAITGIFADNYIGTVTNQNGSDIRGDIVASGVGDGLPAEETISPITGLPVVSNATTGAYINSIDLSDGGSIIGAEIFTTTTLAQAPQPFGFTATGYLVTQPNTAVNGNTSVSKFAIGTISLTGDGGIIGSVFREGGIDAVSVAGFGIFNSDFVCTNIDVVGNISAAGYGIRSCTIEGQNSVQSIAAVGSGHELSVTHYSTSVRQSESGATADAYSGDPLDVYDDLDKVLGVSLKQTTRKGSTEAGVIADTTITGTFGLGSVTAWRIVGNVLPPTTTTTTTTTTGTTTTTTTPSQTLAELIAPLPTMEIVVANNIGTIAVAENTTNLTVTTGTLNSFSSAGNVFGTDITVAGQIKRITAGFFNGSTHIFAQGPDGIIDYLATTGSLNANINASVGIGEILVNGNLDSTTLDSGGNLDELYVKGNVQKYASVIVARTLGKLVIRRNLLGGSTIQAGALTSRNIGGVTNGNIIITGH
jgi:hypothetical protein